jgi:hypothetical protein
MQFIFQPEMPEAAKHARSFLSVVFPFWDFTSAMMRDRASFVTLSTVF